MCVEFEDPRQWWPLVPANGRASPDTRLMATDDSFPQAEGILVFLTVSWEGSSDRRPSSENKMMATDE